MDQLKQQWQQRQQELGNTTRAVLFKNFPAVFNEKLHSEHVRFLLDNLPQHTTSLLDVGCGYGRTAAALKQHDSGLAIEGVELCEEFARAFETNIGPCFMGSVLDFHTTKQFDAITVVTLLMYLDHAGQMQVLAELWRNLQPGGRLLLIEPCYNILTALRRRFRLQNLAPTGGEVCYFRPGDFRTLLTTAIPDARFVLAAKFNLPLAGFPCLHLGAVLEKPGAAN